MIPAYGESQLVAHARAFLNAIMTRMGQAAEAMDWAMIEKPALNPADLVLVGDSDEARAAAVRHLNKLAGIGRKIYNKRLWGAIGSVNWKNDEGDTSLEALKLEALARECFKRLFCTGIAAVQVTELEFGEPKLTPLGGHLEIIPDPDDVNTDWALLQVWPVLNSRYKTRLYDLQTGAVYEHNLGKPTDITELLKHPLEGAFSLPVYATVSRDGAGFIVGEMAASLAELRGELADRMTLERMKENQAHSLLALQGKWNTDLLNSARVITSGDEKATAQRIFPGPLEEIRTEHIRRLEKLDNDFSLPRGFSSGQVPSGQALIEHNQSFLQACGLYAGIIGDLLTRGVEALAESVQIKAVPITVSVNREAYRETVMAEVQALYKEKLISPAMAVSKVSEFYPEWSNADVKAWIAKLEAPAPIPNAKEVEEPPPVN